MYLEGEGEIIVTRAVLEDRREYKLMRDELRNERDVETKLSITPVHVEHVLIVFVEVLVLVANK